MSKTIEAIYENGVFRPLEPVSLPEGRHVSISLPDMPEQIKQRIRALEEFEASFENLTPEGWRLFDEAIERRPWFRESDLNL
jgi:predicted DNA-binding antitoxin AbrB/MazE fold protein